MDQAYKSAKTQILMLILLEDTKKREQLLIEKLNHYVKIIKDKEAKKFLKYSIEESQKHIALCREMMIKLNL